MNSIQLNKQFKSNVLVVEYKFKMEKKLRATLSVLSKLFLHGTQEIQTKRALKAELDSLYNTTMRVSYDFSGDEFSLNFVFQFVDLGYIDNTLTYTEQFHLFETFIQTPYFEHAEDFSTNFELEKSIVIDQIQSLYDDKTQYAFSKLQENLLRETNYLENLSGSLDEVRSVQLDDCLSLWQMIKSTAKTSTWATTSTEATKKAVEEFSLKFNTTQPTITINDPVSITSPKIIEEFQNISQTKLNLAYTLGSQYGAKNYFAMCVAVSVLGGGAHALLFQNVREKHSLAYYANAFSDFNAGILYVYSGINIEKYSLAKEVIADQLLNISTGKFDDKLVDTAKLVLINGLRESLNKPLGIIQFERRKHLFGVRTIEEFLSHIQQVTKEEIIECAGYWNFIGEFTLKPKEDLDEVSV